LILISTCSSQGQKRIWSLFWAPTMRRLPHVWTLSVDLSNYNINALCLAFLFTWLTPIREHQLWRRLFYTL
jgi:hypothetical protein